MSTLIRHDREGLALVTVLLTLLAVTTMAVAGLYLASTAVAVNAHDSRQGVLENAADAALEEGRALINAAPSVYPSAGYSMISNRQPLYDAAGDAIPGVTRTVYAGPTGQSTGQYGVFGSIVAVVEAGDGTRVVRRSEIYQESFAKFAYFTDIEGNIVFGGGDRIYGPLHSNDDIQIHNTGATFFGSVTTAGRVDGIGYGDFREGAPEQYAGRIPMPSTRALSDLEVYARQGHMHFDSNTNGDSGEAELRLEFVALDVDGDGERESFLMAYQNSNEAEVVAHDLGSAYDVQNSRNCGANYVIDGDSIWLPAPDHPLITGTREVCDWVRRYWRWEYRCWTETEGSDWDEVVMTDDASCRLGGDRWLDGDPAFEEFDPLGGRWLRWTEAVDPEVEAAYPDLAPFLWPLTRKFNPTYKGVIHITGKVAISGTVRGMHTIAATDNIVIADDLVYDTDPGSGLCRDLLGIFSGNDVVVSDNALNRPIYLGSPGTRSFGKTTDEYIHGVVLALDRFTVENYDDGTTMAEYCQTNPSDRGCLYLTGGIIQRQRGAVGTTSGSGYIKRYSYDTCVLDNQPPYFPTTGHFAKGRYFEVDSNQFDVAEYFNLLNGGS